MSQFSMTLSKGSRAVPGNRMSAEVKSLKDGCAPCCLLPAAWEADTVEGAPVTVSNTEVALSAVS